MLCLMKDRWVGTDGASPRNGKDIRLLCDIATAYHNRRKWVKHITRLKIYFAQKNASCIEIWNPLAGRIYMLADISDISSISIPHDTRLGLHKLHDLWYTLNTKTITKRWVTPNV